MMAVLGFLVFAAALAASLAVFAFTLLPALPRIAGLLVGEEDIDRQRVERLVLSDRRARTRVMAVAPIQSYRVAA